MILVCGVRMVFEPKCTFVNLACLARVQQPPARANTSARPPDPDLRRSGQSSKSRTFCVKFGTFLQTFGLSASSIAERERESEKCLRRRRRPTVLPLKTSKEWQRGRERDQENEGAESKVGLRGEHGERNGDRMGDPVLGGCCFFFCEVWASLSFPTRPVQQESNEREGAAENCTRQHMQYGHQNGSVVR